MRLVDKEWRRYILESLGEGTNVTDLGSCRGCVGCPSWRATLSVWTGIWDWWISTINVTLLLTHSPLQMLMC